MAGTPVWILLKTVFESILQVFLISLSGWFLAKRNILDKKVLKQLNRLNISIFTPSLLFSKVAFSLSPEKLRELWVIPAFFVIVTGLSMIVVQYISRMMRLTKMQRNFATAACMFMNSNSLPVALMQSLVSTVPHLKWGDDDTSSAMLGRALTYLVLYSSLGMIVRWSYGVMLLSGEDDSQEDARLPRDELVSSPLAADGHLVDIDAGEETEVEPSVREDRDQALSSAPILKSISAPEARRRTSITQLAFSFPNTPVHSRTDLGDDDRRPYEVPPEGRNETHSEGSTDYGSGTDEPLRFASRHQFSGGRRKHLAHWRFRGGLPAPITTSTRGRTQMLFKLILRKAKSFIRAVDDIMTPPLYAAIASLIVALLPRVQTFLNDHMEPFKGALKNAGECSIPITLIVLGGYFYTPPNESPKNDGDHGHDHSPRSSDRTLNYQDQPSSSRVTSVISLTSNPTVPKPPPIVSTPTQPSVGSRQNSLLSASWDASQPGETKTVIVALVSRMLIVPVLLFPLFWLSTKTGWQEVFDDPVFVVCCVLLASSPPAVTLAQIVPKSSGDSFERLISRTIFWAYCILTPPSVILYVVLGLWLSKL